MDPIAEEQLDYGDEDYGGGQKMQYQGGGAISALAEEELMGEDDEYDDLYNDVNVGDGFLQLQRSEAPVPLNGVGNGKVQAQKADGPGSRVPEPVGSQEVSIPGVGLEGKGSNMETSFPEQKKVGFLTGKGLTEGIGDYPDGVSQKERVLDVGPHAQVGSLGFQGSSSMPPKVGVDPSQMVGKFVSGSSSMLDSGTGDPRGAPPMPNNRMGMNVIVNRPMVNENPSRPPVENGTTMLFVGELHWWTTDAELESVLSQYGRVKEIKFFDERASGKSKGYCQVEFYDSVAAAACKEGMNGYIFNGRACVVAFASPQTLKQMGSAYLNKNQGQAQSQSQGRRPMNDGVGRGGGMNYPAGEGGRNYGKVGWGRGGQGILNRGPGGGGPMRGRGGSIGAKSMVGSTGGVGGGASGGPYGQGLPGAALGGPAGGMMHPQSMMGAGFDPTYMGRGGPYGGFSGAAFHGMIPPFQAVNTVALPGVAPHVNPAFFGRAMPANGMGIMGSGGMDGHHVGMWTDTSMVGWGGEDHGRRTRESSYGVDDGASDYGYGEASHERGGGRSNAPSREKDRGSERDWSGNSERRHRDERDQDWEMSERDHRYKEEKDSYKEPRHRERDWDNEDDRDRGQSSSRSRSKSHMIQEEDHRSRSRDADYGKRRRLPSD